MHVSCSGPGFRRAISIVSIFCLARVQNGATVCRSGAGDRAVNLFDSPAVLTGLNYCLCFRTRLLPRIPSGSSAVSAPLWKKLEIFGLALICRDDILCKNSRLLHAGARQQHPWLHSRKPLTPIIQKRTQRTEATAASV